MAGDVHAAAASASMASGGKNKKFRIVESHLPSDIPHGAEVFVEPVAFGKLSMGDIICVNLNGAAKVRRFVKLKMTTSDTYLLAAYEGYDKKEALPKSSLVGRVVKAEAAGKSWTPGKENILQKFWSKLTEYGTHKPFGLG